MLHLLLAAVLFSSGPELPPSASGCADAGVFPDAEEHGQIVDTTEAGDAGAHTEELVTPRVNVRIVGAKVLPPEVYLDMLRLPSSALPNEATAAAVRQQMSDYLERTGFVLARVDAALEQGDIVVRVDEGQIDRLIYVGALSFQQVRFKLALSLPASVFNRPLLDRQVRELSEAMGMDGVRWELVRTGEVDHVGPQLEQLPTAIDLSMQGAEVVHARRPYEVRIRFPNTANGTGLGLHIRSSPTDGLETGLSNRWGGLIVYDDRLLLAASGGIGLRSALDTGKLYFVFSRGFVEARYDTPLLLHRLRPNLWAQNEWLTRQRGDLALENYWAVTVDAALQLEYEASAGLHFLVGGGFEWRRLFGFTNEVGFSPPPTALAFRDVDRGRVLLRLTGEWIVDPEVVRWDRRHVLDGEAREYLGVGEQGLGWVDLRYQYVKSFGWHDLWVKTHGHLSWGDVTFHDEVSLGNFTRGLFASQYVPSALDLSVEFRFSVSRDLIKVSLFNDLALYAAPRRDLGGVEPRLAGSFGPGLHLLVSDMFQIDLYVAFGFRRRAEFGTAFGLQFQKAF